MIRGAARYLRPRSTPSRPRTTQRERRRAYREPHGHGQGGQGKTAAASFITKNVLPQMNAVSSSADFALACVECMGISPTFDREKWIKRKWTLHRFGGTIKIIKTQGGFLLKRIRHLLRRLLPQAWRRCCAARCPRRWRLDEEPPLYEVYSYASPEEFMELFLGGDEGLTYDMVSSKYALYIQALEADEKPGLQIITARIRSGKRRKSGDDAEALIAELAAYPSDRGRVRHGDGRRLGSGRAGRTGCVRLVPRTPPAVSVQLNRKAIVFPDAQPESRNDRTMVPFRAIAETMGAAVSYTDNAVTAEAGRADVCFAAGCRGYAGDFADAESAAIMKTVALDAVPLTKEGRTWVPVRFFAEAFGLTVR